MDSSTDIHMDKDMGGPPVPKKPTLVTPEEFMVRLGEMVMALLLGEIIHRIILFFEELPHVKERWERQKCIFLKLVSFRNIRYNGNKWDMFKAVFSNCHNQVGCLSQSGWPDMFIKRIFQGNLWSIAGCDRVWACLAWELLLLLAGDSDRTFHHTSPHFTLFMVSL